MISAENALKDYEEIVNSKDDAILKVVRLFRIVIKLLLTIRTNQLLPEEEKKAIHNRVKKSKDRQVEK